jgi:repressor LexA
MLHNLTSTQQKVFKYYEGFIKKNGRPPTYEEAGRDLEVAASVVFNHIKNLEKKGYLKSSSKKEGSGVKITPRSEAVSISVLGEIACGKPISVYENREEYIDIPKTMLKGDGPFYALYASGFSMVNAGISDRDILIIRKQDDVNDGDIAVVVLGNDAFDEEATLKRVYKKNSSVLLKPENDEMGSVFVSDCKIRGKLIGLVSMEE